MKNINLIDIEKSDVRYTLTTFPDGEPHIKVDDIDRKCDYQVICRVTNPNELYVLMQVGDILKRQGVEFDIVLAYLMSMRMDRVINFNESFTLNLVADMINALNARAVYIYEVHSDRAFKLIKNSKPYEPNFYFSETTDAEFDYVVCYPDHGAFLRYSDCNGAEKCICMNKVRDLENNGKITSIEIVKEPKSLYEKNILVYDDLCDSGGTFCWAAKVLKEKYPDKSICVFVKHLVNSVGLKNLSENFDKVYITNSYKDWDISEFPNITMYKVF